MMKNWIIIFVLLIVVTAIGNSCKKVEDIVDFPINDPTMVLNCYFTPAEDWKIQLSRSLSVIDNADLTLINDATIKLYEDGQLIATLNQINIDGYYTFSGKRPKSGAKYKVEATHPKYESISSEEIVPLGVNFDIVKLKVTDSSTYYNYWLKKNVGTLKGSASIRIKDDANESNYYRIVCYYYDSTDIMHIYKDNVWLESDNIALEKKYSNGLLFSDALFNGKTFDINFKFDDYNYYSGKTYFYVVENMNSSRFNYERSVAHFWDAKNDPFSEPVQVYNNIKNGYGIFASFTSSVKTIYFK